MSPRALSPEEMAELSAYLDGELDVTAAERLRERLETDPELAAALRALARVDTGLRAIPVADIPPALAARMRARIDAERGSPAVVPLRPAARGAREPRRGPRPVLYAAAALAAALALTLLIRAQISGGPEPAIAPLPEPAIPGVQPLEERALPPLEERELVAPRPPDPPAPAFLPAPLPDRPMTLDTTPLPETERIVERARDAIESATDEELFLALELEALGAEADQAEDLAIIEQLEFVEMLRDLGARGRRG